MPEQDYPDLKLDSAVADAIALYLESEIDSSMRARVNAESIWNQIKLLYEQLEATPGGKDIPFEDSSNIMVSLIATYVEQLHARIHGTLYESSNPYAVEPTRQDLVKYSKVAQKWLTWASENELNEELVDYSALMEMLKLGTMVEKVVYERVDVKLQNYNPELKKWEPRIERMKDNPEHIHISIFDFFWQMHARNIDESIWKAHRLRLSWNEVKLRVADGRWNADAAEKIRAWYESQKTDAEQVVDDQVGIEPHDMFEFEFFEVWFEYPIHAEESELPIDEGTNIYTSVGSVPVKMKCVLHKDARILMTYSYNDFPLGLDPFEVCTFVGREREVLGIGIGQMALTYQIEITAMHNQRIDGGTVANSVGYKYKADSRVAADLRIRPGSGIPVDEMDDFDTFQWGSKIDSTIEAENQSLALLKERIGIRDLALDDALLSQAPATTTTMLLAEKGRRLDGVIGRIRKFKKRMILKTLLLYKRYYPKEKLVAVFGNEEGAMLMELLSLPDQLLWDSVGISVTATTSASSREMERQNDMQLLNAVMGYYDKYVSYISVAANPQTPPAIRLVTLSMANGLSAYILELLEGFNKKSRRDFVIDTGPVAALIQQQLAQPPAAPPAAGNVQDGGVQPAQPNGQAGGQSVAQPSPQGGARA